MSDCVLFPASLPKNRAWSVWADRESYLSLAEGAYTLIRPRVQPCGWKRYVRVGYRNSRFNESHQNIHSVRQPEIQKTISSKNTRLFKSNVHRETRRTQHLGKLKLHCFLAEIRQISLPKNRSETFASNCEIKSPQKSPANAPPH